MAVRLSDVVSGRDNNFNLIRFIAASMVIFFHAYPLTGTHGGPLQSLGLSLGHVAVDIFFVTSGYLVTGSLVNRENLLAFIVARILRIYPALIVAVLFCVFGVGLFFTTQPVGAYLSDPSIYHFLRNNALLIEPLHWYLPGVFDDNIYKGAVNGSLWTLPYEIKMYVILAALGSLVFISPGIIGRRTFRVLIVSMASIAMLAYLLNHALQYTKSFDFIFTSRFIAMFFAGATCYLFRESILLSVRLFVLLLAVLVYFSDAPSVFFILYSLVLSYLVLFAAYVPAGRIRYFNRLGDYSYGVYIYAFPVQQSIAAMAAGVSAMTMAAIAWPITLLLAVISWHLIEKPMLAKKDFFQRLHLHWRKFISVPNK